MIELTPEQIAWIEAPHMRSMWGSMYRVTPKFIREALGDGGRLLGLQTLNSRPDYYVIRVDSNWQSAHSFDSKKECIADHMDEIYDAIEMACGSADDWMDEDPPTNRNAPEYDWPALDTDCGSSWFDYELPERMPEPIDNMPTVR
jgi:hypothetical protein